MSSKVLFVFPCFNPKPEQWDRLKNYIHTIRSVSKLDFDFLVVDDGSQSWCDPSFNFNLYFQLLRLDKNQGKGGALLAAASRITADHKVFAFTDFDLPYSFENALGMIGSVLVGADLCIGDRSQHDPAVVRVSSDRLSRKFSHKLFRLFIRTIITGGVEDTQCGLKAFDAKALTLIVSHAQIKGFLFDVEWIYTALRHKLSIRSWPLQILASHESSPLRSFGNLALLTQLWQLINGVFSKKYDIEELYAYMDRKRESMKTSVI